MSFSEELDLDLKEYLKPDRSNDNGSFDSLPLDDKLSKLQLLVQKSQLYSQIILDNMLEKSIEKKKLKEQEQKRNAQQGLEAQENCQTNRDQKTDSIEVEDLTEPGPSSDHNSDFEKVELRRSTRSGRSAIRTIPAKRSKRVVVNRGSNPEPTMKAKVSAEAERMRAAIEAAQTGHNQRQPDLVTGCVMKGYQLDGLEWLISLYENGLNGILADEMGLGKTLQCIALFSFLIENRVEGPFLVVAPLSTVRNWGSEFKKFAPDIDVVEYAGAKDVRKKIVMNNRMKESVVITSYELIIRDFLRFSRLSWGYLTVDEGHRLKNFQSILVQFLKKLDTSNRLLLTGTPLQNNLKELWSLLNFILPDIFHDLDLFERWFNFDEFTSSNSQIDSETKSVINEKVRNEIIKSLHTILRPFLLRRIKREVIDDLPPKKEYIVYSDLQPLQQFAYHACLQGKFKEVFVELYVKEYLLYNENKLFSSKEDLEVVDSMLNKLQDSTVENSYKRSRIDYLEDINNTNLNQILDADEELSFEVEESSDSDHQDTKSDEKQSRITIREHTETPSNKYVISTERERAKEDVTVLTDTESERFVGNRDYTDTRETSIDNSPLQKGKKRAKRPLYIDENVDDDSSIDIIEEFEIPKIKRQKELILRVYRMAEQHVKHLSMKNRLASLRTICGSHYSYYFPFALNEHDVDKEEEHEKKFAQLLHLHSGKIQVLDQLLSKLLQGKHKVLIFSQFTTVLDLLQTRLLSEGIITSRIDGRYSIDERRDQIERFSGAGESSSQVFLISTRAGGLGLNLTEADTVILFDNDWNPQMDLQAIDRVHRIGQKMPVKIFRFAVRNTVEEIIIMKSFGKRALEQLVIRLGNFQLSRVAKKLAEENIDISTLDANKSLFSLSEKLSMHGFEILGELPNMNEALLGKPDSERPKLLDEEMEELMDRSPECYARGATEYYNLTSFESFNNLDN